MTNEERAKESDIAIYIGLGSNLGDREANLREAAARIEKLGIEIARESSIYETEPAGFLDQPWFLNQVIEVKLPAEPDSEDASVFNDPKATAAARAESLLSRLLAIERAMGRERTITHGPRVIDIDLLLFGDSIIAHSPGEGRSFEDRTEVFVPHPRMHLRRFVLEPLCEIAPGVIHPKLEKTCHELLAALDDPSTVTLIKREAATDEHG